jgi:hypothetical protein
MLNGDMDARFARVPIDFVFALERGEITLDQWAIGAFLVGKVDFRRNEVSYTLRALADATGWGKSSEVLRQTVLGLRDGEWIHFTSSQGKRSPYVFSLGRLHRNGDRHANFQGDDVSEEPPSWE